MADPHDAERPDTKRRRGGHFDPDWFDLATTEGDIESTPSSRLVVHDLGKRAPMCPSAGFGAGRPASARMADMKAVALQARLDGIERRASAPPTSITDSDVAG